MDVLDVVQAWLDPVAYEKNKNSTNIMILVNGNVVGVAQSLHYTTKLNVNFNGTQPSSKQINVTANRVRFDSLRVQDAFDKGFINGYSQKLPFSIKIDSISSPNCTIIDEAWITDCDYTYHTNNFDIVDSMKLEAAKIDDEEKVSDKNRNFVTQLCKFCEAEITIYPLIGSFKSGPNRCEKCQKYGFCLLPNGIVETEIVTIGNFFLIFIPSHNEANIVSVDSGKDHKIVNRFSLSELTHESVLQWSVKLKTYVIFQ